ncbi:MAG: oxidoreductase [Pedosphaera sp.]|nr:oxidoreductase [Pedosphaera sp.]
MAMVETNMSNNSVAKSCFLLAGILLSFSLNTRAEWQFQPSPTTNTSLRSVFAVSAKTVWSSGSGGVCLRTTNGGQTWENLSFPGAEKMDFRGVVAFDAQRAILMSAGEAEQGLARIYRTSDGGRHWRLVCQTWDKGVFLDGLAFWDSRNGIAFSDPLDGKWYLLKTSDGGNTWQHAKTANLPAMLPNEAAFAAGNSSIATLGSSKVWLASGGADRARVFASNDRGQTWQVRETPMPSGPTAGIFGLRFWDSKHGIAVGGDHKADHAAGDNVIITDDGGRTWRTATPTDPPGLKETVVMLPSRKLLAVGPSGTSTSVDFGMSWQRIDSSSFHAASVANGHCWAVGANGLIATWK